MLVVIVRFIRLSVIVSVTHVLSMRFNVLIWNQPSWNRKNSFSTKKIDPNRICEADHHRVVVIGGAAWRWMDRSEGAHDGCDALASPPRKCAHSSLSLSFSGRVAEGGSKGAIESHALRLRRASIGRSADFTLSPPLSKRRARAAPCLSLCSAPARCCGQKMQVTDGWTDNNMPVVVVAVHDEEIL